jgi:hypothetical protein
VRVERVYDGIMKRMHVAALLAACACVVPASASRPTMAECFEGSDFIANAALARENGMSRAAFLGRLEDDLELIQAYPPQLRWFAKDREDETFLYEYARQVFDEPLSPDQHRARFLAACLDRGMA